MNCKNCGRSNPSGSLYCQDCGHRLGDWVPPERAGRAPTPPTGIARGVQAAPASATCPRCGTTNAAHMRFCNNCGFQLTPPSPLAAAAPAPAPAPAYAAAPVYAQPPTPGASVCWRCRAAGDAGAEFCKFCGARYADDPARAQAAPAHYAANGAPAGGAGGAIGAGAMSPSPMAASPMAASPLAASPLAASPLAASPLAASPMAGSPLAASPMAASPMGASPMGASPLAASPMAGAPMGASPMVGAQQAAPPMSAAPAAPRAAELPGPSAEGAPRALLVAILKDGSDGRVYAIHDEQTDLGRSEGHLLLSDDPYLSARHARVLARASDGLAIRDLDSLNGVYVRLREPVDLHDGDMVLLGQQVMRFEVLSETELPLGPATQRGVLVFGTPEAPRMARLVQYTTEGVGRDVHYLYRDETVIGREQGDIVCTDDPFMSRRHAAITIDRSQRRFVLRDLGSSNGTAVRIRGERVLRPGDQFRVGRHLFRYDRPGDAGQRHDQGRAGG